MRAAVFNRAISGFEIGWIPEPEPGPDDLLIQVKRCGICGSDLHMAEPGDWQFRDGAVPGHEYAGEVLATGRDVSSFRPGDRVTALPATGCGHCAACERGNLILCGEANPVMGGFGELMRVPAISAMKLPTTLTSADGALIEPLAVGLYAIRQAAIKADDRVLVLGAGSVALAAIYWARRAGVRRIVAMSRSTRRAAQARQFGADAFVCYGENEQPEVVEALGGEADVVLECVGRPGFLMQAIGHVRKFGRVASLGFCMAPDPLVPAMAAFRGVSLCFPLGYSLGDFQYVAEHMDAGHVDPKSLVTSVVTLDEMPAKFEALLGAHGETKVHIAPG